MRRIGFIFTVVALLAAVSPASLVVYEGFGDPANEGQTLAGYSGTNAESGLTGSWAISGGDAQKLTVRSNPEYVGVNGGYTPETVGGNQHWWEKNSQWWTTTAQRALSGTIDLNSDGTHYMSFFTMSPTADIIVQMGLNDGTNELMWGNAYSGNASKGLTAYYGTIGTNAQTNANGTFVTYADAGGYQTGFYLAELIKSNSGTTNDLVVNMSFYNFGTLTAPTHTVAIGDPWTRTVNLTGVTGLFNTLELKLDGGSAYPSMDEIRIGQTWTDATGIPEPATLMLLAAGAVALRRGRKA